ncbi:MAG: hypothetical protein ACI8RD_009275, partial [Bacillariaceae sp.]|jgi:hypothetical protein
VGFQDKMSSNNNTATTDDTTTATENFEQNDAVLALQQLGARVQPQQPRQPQQQQQQLQQEGTSSGTAATAAHRPSSQQQQQQQRNTIEGLRDDQLRRLQRLHHSAKERSQRGPTRQAQLMYEREQREQQKQQQHELLLMHLHGIIPPPLPVGLQGILGGTNVGLGAGAGAGLSLSSMAEHQELLLMNLHGIGPPPLPLHPPAYTPLPIGMMFPGSTISNAIIDNNSNNYDNIVRNSNILVLQQQQQIAAITSAIDIDESQCSSQSVPPSPLLLTDLKPGILTIFKRLIKEHSIQYEYFVTNNIISIRREIGRKARNDRAIRLGDMGANGIIDQVYYELHGFCSPYPNLMLEFPSKLQFNDLIRSSLEYECEVQQRLRQQQQGRGGGGSNSKNTYNNENTIGSLLPSIYVEQNALFKKTEKVKVPTLTPPSSSLLASTVRVYPSASLSSPTGISSRIGTGVGVGFVPPTATSSAPQQLPTVPITTMTTSKFPICQFRFPMEMYQDVDKRFVSPFECLLRKELLIFEADKDDVLLSSQSRIIKVGQVGLRCRHCVCSARHIDRSTWYPKSLKEMDTMFDAIFEQHFLKNCTLIPKRLKLELNSMQQARNDFYLHDLDNPFGDSYWSEQLITLGVYEDGIDTLRVNRGERNASILFAAAAAAAATGVVVAPAHYVNASTVVAPVTIGSNNELRQRSIVQQQSPHRVSATNANVIIPDIQQQPTHKKEVVRSNADPNNGNKKAPTKKDNKARRHCNFKKEQKSSFSVSAVDGNSATITPPDSKGTYSMSQQDLDLCRGLIKKLRSKNNSKFNSPFLFPFHPSETPGYLDICSCRTDISTLSHKLENGAYSNRSKFYDACNMIFTNALKYHSDKPKTQWVILRAERMLEIAKMEQEKIENKVTAGTTTQKTSVPAKETLELLAQDLVRPSASGTDPPSNTAAVPVIQDPDTGTGVIPDRILSKAAQRVLKRLAPFNSAGITTEGDNKYILGRALTISTERRRRASAPNFNSLASAGKGKNRKSSSVTLKKKSRTTLLASSKTECNDDIDNDNNKKRKATFPPSKISTKKNTTRNGVIGASATDGEDNGDSGPPFKRVAASSRVEAESEEEIPTPSIQMKNDKLDESVEKCLPKSVRRALKNLAPFNDPSSTTDSSALASSSRLRLKRTRNSL